MESRAFDSHALFGTGTTIETIPLVDLVAWRERTGSGRLLVPPIQRSLVWRNAQILRYFDSLLRGFPPGMIQVHRVLDGTEAGIDAEGGMRAAGAEDWQLFDGQQRLTSMALALGRGIWASTRTVWIDLGVPIDRRHRDDNDDGFLFQLRMTTPSQPFGYDRNRPDDKLSASKQRLCWQRVIERHGDDAKDWTAADVFARGDAGLIADAVRPVRLADLCEAILSEGSDAAIAAYAVSDGTCIAKEAIAALGRALRAGMVVQRIDERLIAEAGEYERYFERVGRGGTPLSEAELIYSKLKHRHPALHDTMRDVMNGDAKRLAGEVDLVMATVRVARAIELGGAGTTRPRPKSMYGEGWKAVETRFLGMVGDIGRKGSLPVALAAVREAIEHSRYNSDGFPTMLLARLPKHLLDVLLLIAYRGNGHAAWTEDGKQALIAMSLHWMLFVHDGERAADRMYQAIVAEGWRFSVASIRGLVAALDADRDVCRLAPRPQDVERMRAAVQDAGAVRLRRWHERFVVADVVDGPQPGDAMRRMTTDRDLVQKALMWLQRDYVGPLKADYDPTAGTDEDMPVDLDHLIPASTFDDDWRVRAKCLAPEVDREAFRHGRWPVGNSLGNFRWLEMRRNRERQDGEIVVEQDMGRYLVDDVRPWNAIIAAQKQDRVWTLAEVAGFQRLVDGRSLDLYERIWRLLAPSLQ